MNDLNWDLELRRMQRSILGRRGATSALARRMSEICGQPRNVAHWRTQIERWLCRDAGRRVEPTVGTGLLLIAEVRKMVEEAGNSNKPQ